MADKNNIGLTFSNQYQRLTDSEKELFSRIGNKLLNKTFLIKQKDNDREDYFFVLSHLTLFQNYFLLMDYNVYHYEGDQVIALQTEANRNRVRLKKIDTIMLLILRLIYQKKTKEASQINKIMVSVGEIHEEIEKTGLIKGKLTKIDLQTTMRTFKNFSLIDYISSNLFNDETKIVIYPSLLRVVNIDDMNRLETVLKDFNTGGDDDEDSDED